jgi:hypothetical protein
MEINPPAWLQDGAHTAQGDRLVLSSLIGVSGVVGTGDLQVTEKAGTPDMAVDVAAGSCYIAGTQATFQGTYHCTNDATKTLSVPAADSTNPRIDLVVARVRDSFYAGVGTVWELKVEPGAAAASPAEPAVPVDAIVLARIDVPAGATAITNADLTDRRPRAALRADLLEAAQIAAPTVAGGIATKGYVDRLIEEKVVGSATGSVTFSGIPQNYLDLILSIQGWQDSGAGAGVGNLYLQFNGDGGTNYHRFRVSTKADGTVSISKGKSQTTLEVGHGGRFGCNADLRIPFYTAGAARKGPVGLVWGYDSETEEYITQVGGRWAGTAAINSVTVGLVGNWSAGSRLVLYGDR